MIEALERAAQEQTQNVILLTFEQIAALAAHTSLRRAEHHGLRKDTDRQTADPLTKAPRCEAITYGNLRSCSLKHVQDTKVTTRTLSICFNRHNTGFSTGVRVV